MQNQPLAKDTLPTLAPPSFWSRGQSYINKQKPNFLIKVWEKPLLEKLCPNKIDLLRKYSIVDTYQITDFAVAERIFASRLEAFEDMLCKVTRKMGIEDATSDLLNLDKLWTRFAQKAGWNGSEYFGYVRHVKAAGLAYSYGDGEDSIEKIYSVEELSELAEQLIKLMMCVDLYAQLNGIKYSNLK